MVCLRAMGRLRCIIKLHNGEQKCQSFHGDRISLDLLLRKRLQLNIFVVIAPLRKQLVMRARLADPPVFDEVATEGDQRYQSEGRK